MVVLQHAGLFALGAWAVHVFFILSGYWVTAMWEHSYRKTHLPYFTFMVSRYWRLLPIYLACYALITLWFWAKSPLWSDLAAHWMTPSWSLPVLFIIGSSYAPTPLVPTWSLDIEMQFYVVAPLLATLIAAGTRWRAPFRQLGFVALIVASAAAYALRAPVGKFLFFFLVGMLLWASRWKSSATWARVSALGAVAVVAIFYFVPATHHIVASPAVGAFYSIRTANEWFSAGLAVLIVPFIAFNVQQRGGHTLDRHLGNLAYSVYLFHMIPQLAGEWVLEPRGWPHWLINTATFSIMAVGSVLLYVCVDRPFDALRHRWVKSRRKDIEPTPVPASATVSVAG